MVELRVRFAAREPGRGEPAVRKFIPTVAHVNTAEDAELEHRLGRNFRPEFDREIRALARRQLIAIAGLHSVVNDHPRTDRSNQTPGFSRMISKFR